MTRPAARPVVRCVLALALMAAVVTTAGVGAEAAPQQSPPPAADPSPSSDPAAPDEAILRITAPDSAPAGEPFTIAIEIEVDQAVAAYRADITATGTEIEPTAGGALNDDDLVTDRNVGSLGDRAVLAATSCAGGGCGRGQLPQGITGTVSLGTVAVTASSGGPTTVTVALTELVRPDGSALGGSPHRETTITVEITGSDEPTTDPTAPTVDDPTRSGTPGSAEPSPEEEGPVEERPDPEADFAQDIVARCDPADPGCTTIAEVQQAGAQQEAATVAAPAAAASSLILVVDSASDAFPAYDTNPGDGVCQTPSGACTLRAAMHEANAFAGPVAIDFDIAGPGPHTIDLEKNLPATTDDAGVTIDGYSQPGAAANTDPLVSNAVIMIEIRGGGPTAFDALKIRSDNNLVTGLAIYDARRPIWMFGAGANRIVGNFIGTDAAGTFATNVLAPTAHGIHVEGQSAGNIIGGPAAADRNVVSGNARHGIGIWHHNSDDNVIQNNIVGLSPDGTTPLPNAKHGIDVNFGAARTVVGGLGPGEGNLVSGNVDTGIEVSHNPLDGQGVLRDMNTQVLGNRIGTYADGETFSPTTANLNTGVYVEDGVNNTIIEGNTIGNNDKGGVRVLNGGSNGVTTGTVIRNNHIGVSPLGTAMPNGQVGVSVESSTTTVGPGNTIAYTPGPAITSTELDAFYNTITRNTMIGNAGLGIELSPTGTNANDPGDADTGPNELLNWPELARTTTSVFEGTACTGCTIELFTVDLTPGAGLAGGSYLGSVAPDPVTGAFSFANPAIGQGQSVTATATDASGNTSEFAPASPVVEHSDPPVVDAGFDVAVAEGATVDLTATATDPDDDPISYDWDLDGDAVFETPGQAVSFDAALIDGPAIQVAMVRATDDTGLWATDTLTVTIDNAEPTGTLQAPTAVDEASSFAVSVVGADDPSPADLAAGLRYAIVCPGDSPTVPDYATASTSSARTCTAPDGPAAPTLEAHILDDDGGIATVTAPLTVDNTAPMATIDGVPGGADEGGQLNLTVTVTDPAPEDQAAGFTYAWTIARNGVVQATGTNPTIDVDLTDSGTWTVTVDVTDKDGGVGSDTRQLVVGNVDPTAELTTDVAVTGQVEITLTMVNPADPGTDDVQAGLRYAFDCAGASLATVNYAAAGNDPTALCVYTSGASTYPVSAVIIDQDEGRTDYATAAAIGSNQAPTVTVAPSFAIDEGGTVVLAATGTDPEGGAVTYAWDLDGDGDYETTGPAPTFDAALVDGPTTIGIGVEVTDAVGLTASATSDIVVANLDPAVGLDPSTIAEGSTLTVDLSAATDPSPDDQATLRYAVDCDGGSLAAVDYASASATAVFDCVLDDGPAAVVVSAKVLDDDGGSIETSTTVTVDNVDPTASITPPAVDPVEGDQVSIALGATDPSTADAASLGVAWSATFEGAVLASGSGTTADFIVPDDGAVTVDLTVTDKDGGQGAVQALITVEGAAPTGSFIAPPTADEGADFDIEIGNGADAGPIDEADGLRYAFACDGTAITETYASAQTTAQTTCPAGSVGSQTVVGRIIDADDLFTEYSAEVNIDNVAPLARFVVPGDGVAGKSVTIHAFDPSEPGVDYAFDCGSGFGPFGPATAASCPLPSGGVLGTAMTVRDAGGLETTYDGVIVVHPELTGNGSFETDVDGDDGPDGWTLPGSGAVQVTAGAARDGTVGLEATSTTNKFSTVRTGFLPAARSSYDLTGWFNLIDGGTTATAQIEITWYRGDGSAISTSRSDTLTTVTGGWVQLRKQVIAPHTTAQARVRVKLATDGGAVIHVDDVVLRQANELRNPDLDLDDDGDDQPDGWWQITRFARTDDEIHDTAYSGELSSDGSGFTVGQKVRQIVPEADYRVQGWIYITPEAAGTIVRLRVRWRSASDTTISVPVVQVISTATPGWVQIGGNLTAPVDAATGNYEVRVATGLGLGEVIYLDSAYFGLS